MDIADLDLAETTPDDNVLLINEAVQELEKDDPEQARVVFILHDVHGYKHDEIAEMVNIETGTSKAHLHRARKLLREELSK